MNYRATCVYDNMTVVIENGVEVSRTYEDNRIKIDYFAPTAIVGDSNEQ